MISGLDRAALRAEARAFFGLDPDRPTLLVTGGSQGARRLNQAVSGAAAALAAAGVQVLHVQGKHGGAEPRRPATDVPYVVVDFVDRMDLAYAAADLVVCRAGANSVTEAAAVGLPGDLRAAADRQRRAGARTPGPSSTPAAALLVDDADLTTDWVVAHRARRWPPTPTGWPRWAPRPSALIPRDADEKLARIVLEVGRSGA